MNQKNLFIKSEGDSFYKRNKSRLASLYKKVARDQVLVSLNALALNPRAILEIGCSNGWRLEALRRKYHAKCFGIEPSSKAISDGKALYPAVSLRQGTADELPFDDDAFDLVVFGFCLYLCDRKDLFKIAYEADRVLKDTGHIAIYDFHPLSHYRNPYEHDASLAVYKMDYSRLFAWNPAYTVIALSMFNERDRTGGIDKPDERESVAILQKNSELAYPDNPWSKRVGC